MSQPSTALVADPGEIFAELPRPDGVLRAAVSLYKGHPIVNVRVWYRAADGDLRPCQRRGVSLRLSEIESIGKALLAIAERLRKGQAGGAVAVETAPGDGA